MEFLFHLNVQLYLLAYLIGGIPFGLLLGKVFANVKVTESGSKSIGATNVLRVLKEKNPALAKKLAIATLLLDAIKGVVALGIAFVLGAEQSVLWSVALLSVVGHCFSPYLYFEGGKGVATGLGVLLVMLPIETAVAAAVWAVMAKTVRISSLSSLSALIALMVASFIIHPHMPHAPVVLIAFIIIYKHMPNIYRLIKGQEKQVI